MQNTIVFITGRKGSGKTTLANKMVNARFRAGERCLVVAPMRGIELSGEPVIMSVSDLLNPAYDNRSLNICPGNDPRLPAAAFLYAYTCGNCWLVVDEVDIWTSAQSCDESILNAIRYGRHRGLSQIYISQRPANVIRDLTAQSDYLFMFQSTENRDVEYLAARIGRENAERVRRLKQFDYAVYSAFSGGLVKGGDAMDE